MRIGVPRESAAGERRVALVPESVSRLIRGGHGVRIQRGAGTLARCSDDAYAAAGAELVDDAASLFGGSDVVVKVQRPTQEECDQLSQGAILISLLPVATSGEILDRLSTRSVSALGLERVPRITRAQSMDVLSSQATVAGYKAVLIAASHSARILPMLTTAAGNIPPAKAFVIGAGVAGLMAIATARRLGASVSGFDVRAAAREQVMSLGATFVGPEPSTDAEAAGGYARAQTEEEQRRTMEVLATHLREQDLVITTAQIPGKPAPRLITREMVAAMKSGAVIVDLAAESGGNCELTEAGATREVGGVEIIGTLNLPGTVPYHASVMFSKNVLTLLQHMTREGSIVVDLDDEIVGPMCLTSGGQRRS